MSFLCLWNVLGQFVPHFGPFACLLNTRLLRNQPKIFALLNSKELHAKDTLKKYFISRSVLELPYFGGHTNFQHWCVQWTYSLHITPNATRGQDKTRWLQVTLAHRHWKAIRHHATRMAFYCLVRNTPSTIPWRSTFHSLNWPQCFWIDTKPRRRNETTRMLAPLPIEICIWRHQPCWNKPPSPRRAVTTLHTWQRWKPTRRRAPAPDNQPNYECEYLRHIRQP